MVYKDDIIAYVIKVKKNKQGEWVLACDCSGAIFRFRITKPDKRCRHEIFVFDSSKLELGREVRHRLPILKDKEAFYRKVWEDYKKQLAQNPASDKRQKASFITKSGRW